MLYRYIYWHLYFHIIWYSLYCVALLLILAGSHVTTSLTSNDSFLLRALYDRLDACIFSIITYHILFLGKLFYIYFQFLDDFSMLYISFYRSTIWIIEDDDNVIIKWNHPQQLMLTIISWYQFTLIELILFNSKLFICVCHHCHH